jgi:hypothetical protein
MGRLKVPAAKLRRAQSSRCRESSTLKEVIVILVARSWIQVTAGLERQQHPHPCPSPSGGGKKGGGCSRRDARSERYLALMLPAACCREYSIHGEVLLFRSFADAKKAVSFPGVRACRSAELSPKLLRPHLICSCQLLCPERRTRGRLVPLPFIPEGSGEAAS